MIYEIESEWRATPLTCPACGPDQPMYSDGRQRPQCPQCLAIATDEAIYMALIQAPSDMEFLRAGRV